MISGCSLPSAVPWKSMSGHCCWDWFPLVQISREFRINDGGLLLDLYCHEMRLNVFFFFTVLTICTLIVEDNIDDLTF